MISFRMGLFHNVENYLVSAMLFVFSNIFSPLNRMHFITKEFLIFCHFSCLLIQLDQLKSIKINFPRSLKILMSLLNQKLMQNFPLSVLRVYAQRWILNLQCHCILQTGVPSQLPQKNSGSRNRARVICVCVCNLQTNVFSTFSWNLIWRVMEI